MKKIKEWLLRDDYEHIEWYLAKKEDELNRNYHDRCNYLEQKYAMIVKQNECLQELIMERINLDPNPTVLFTLPTK